MKIARALRILLALALLSAQQVALAHQIWHIGDHGSQPSQRQLCDQHDALGTVVGALDAPIPLLAADATVCASFQSLAPCSASRPGLAPSSRGPPTLL
jgi:hypothetical protein